MKRSIVNAIACVCAFAAFAGTDATVNVTATLKDGSSVRGDFLTKSITGATLFAKKLVLTPSIVKTVNFTSTNGEAKVELSNGDRFAISVSNDVFAVRSILGGLKIPRTSLRAMSLSARTAAAKGGAMGGLIFHCTFDDAAAFTFADTHTPACKIDLVSNDGGGNSGFATCSWFAGIANIRGMRGLNYGDLFTPQSWRDWHHFALVWNKDGISDIQGNPSVALIVDGKQIPNTVFNPCPVELLRMPSKTAYVLSFTYDPASSPAHNTKSPFLIDDFKIWDYAKTDILK